MELEHLRCIVRSREPKMKQIHMVLTCLNFSDNHPKDAFTIGCFWTSEKTFLIHSPMVEKVEVVRVGKARRAKLYYLRDRVGKAAKTKEKIGARIETKEIVIKEEVVPGEAEVVETVEEVPVAEPVVEEVAKTEEAKAETTATEENK